MGLYYSQEKKLRRELANLFNGQKAEVKSLVKLLEEGQDPTSNIKLLYKALSKSYQKVAFGSIDTFTPILISLNKKQLEQFFKKQLERTEKLKEKRNFSERFEKSLKFFLGELTAEQKKTINKKFSPHLEKLNQVRVASRVLTFAKMKKILAKERNSSKNVALKKHFQSQVMELLSNESREKIVDELESFAKDISFEQKSSLKEKMKLTKVWLKEFLTTDY